MCHTIQIKTDFSLSQIRNLSLSAPFIRTPNQSTKLKVEQCKWILDCLPPLIPYYYPTTTLIQPILHKPNLVSTKSRQPREASYRMEPKAAARNFYSCPLYNMFPVLFYSAAFSPFCSLFFFSWFHFSSYQMRWACWMAPSTYISPSSWVSGMLWMQCRAWAVHTPSEGTLLRGRWIRQYLLWNTWGFSSLLH